MGRRSRVRGVPLCHYGLLLVGRNEMVQKVNRERQVSLDEPFWYRTF